MTINTNEVTDTLTPTTNTLTVSGNIIVSNNTTAPVIYGGVGTASTLTLQSTSNASPSGDSIVFKAGSGTPMTIGSNTITLVSGTSLSWNSDTYLTRSSAATLQHGAADAAAPVAQTIQVQSVVGGTTNTAGVNLTINGSRGTGTGAGGSIVFQTAPAGTTGSTQNTPVTALTIGSGTGAGVAGTVTLAQALPVGSGGTGLQTIALNNVILGNGTSAVQTVAPGTSGNVLVSNGTTWTSSAAGGGVTISDDTTTNSNSRYLVFSSATSGTASTIYTSSTKLYFNPSTGVVNANVFNSLSDANYKTNISKISNALDTINMITGVSFDWADTGSKSYGVIAQDVVKVIPEVVDVNDDGRMSVNYSALIAFLIESVKTLSDRIESMENSKI